jgi:molybdopterin biosynthesis enzyme
MVFSVMAGGEWPWRAGRVKAARLDPAERLVHKPRMAASPETRQRIARLTPLREALAIIDTVAPVAARAESPGGALGRVLAHDVRAASAWPEAALALRDGWAVAAESLADASAHAPVALAAMPAAVELGEPLPPGADAVAEHDTVVARSGTAEAVAAVAPGEGVLPAHGDAAADAVLRRAGARVRPIDWAVFAALGIAELAVRVPRVRMITAGRAGAATRAAAGIIAELVERAELHGSAQEPLERALQDGGADAVIAIGGTGSGASDASVRALTRAGEVRFHGVAISPGETAAFGFVGKRPVLLLPGRLDAALAAWLLLGRPLLDRLTGATENDAPAMSPLTRKVASGIGLASVVPVRRRDDGVEPLATGYLSLQALAQADGWILVPAESEGFAPGTAVAVRPL